MTASRPRPRPSFDKPAQVVLDPNGNLLIVDTVNNRIRVVAQSSARSTASSMTAGDIYTVAGTGAVGTTGDSGLATSAKVDHPRGVALDAHGDLIIADTVNCRIRMVAQTTGTYYGAP